MLSTKFALASAVVAPVLGAAGTAFDLPAWFVQLAGVGLVGVSVWSLKRNIDVIDAEIANLRQRSHDHATHISTLNVRVDHLEERFTRPEP